MMEYTKNTINLDWLEFILVGDLKIGKVVDEYIEYYGGFVLRDVGHGTKHWIRMYEVYHDGVLFGNLRLDPRDANVLDPFWQQFKVDNQRLYEKGTLELCKKFFKSIKSSVRNISRIDIACDGFGYTRIMERYHAGMINRIGKRAKYTLHCHDRKVEGFDVGRKKSDKQITGYQKSNEIKKSGKEYIKLFWKRSGLRGWDSGNVERLEMRLKNNAIKKFEDFDWTRLEETAYLAGLMKKSCAKFFEFRHIHASNIARAKPICVIDWDNLRAERLEYKEAKERTEFIRLKQTAKTMFWIYLGCNSTVHLQIAQEIVTNINCVMWFIDKKEQWREEFEKKQKNKSFDYLNLWENESKTGQLILSENMNLSTQYKVKKSRLAR